MEALGHVNSFALHECNNSGELVCFLCCISSSRQSADICCTGMCRGKPHSAYDQHSRHSGQQTSGPDTACQGHQHHIEELALCARVPQATQGQQVAIDPGIHLHWEVTILTWWLGIGYARVL